MGKTKQNIALFSPQWRDPKQKVKFTAYITSKLIDSPKSWSVILVEIN